MIIKVEQLVSTEEQNEIKRSADTREHLKHVADD